jgi:hypothetical protein
MAGPDGTVFIADERAADEFAAPGDPTDRLLHVCSTLHCLLVGRSEDHNHAVGTVFRVEDMRRLATGAGFSSVEVLPIDHDSFRF